MKLSETLKEAVINADWLIICDLYKKITGKKLVPPQPVEDQDVEALTDTVLPEMEYECVFVEDNKKKIETEETSKNIETTDGIHRPMDNARSKQRNTDDPSQEKACVVSEIPPRFTENQFIDDQTEFTDELVTTHPKLALTRPSKTKGIGKDRRSAFSKIEVKCHVCGRREMVKPAFAIGYRENDEANTYRCNGCCAR